MKHYLTELHLHTKESSSCSEIPAKKIIEEYKKEGYSSIVITDHCTKSEMNTLEARSWQEKIDDVYRGFNIAKQYGNELGINILLGIEITLQTTDSDYLVYGMNKEFLYENENIYEFTIKKLYTVCHKKGYLLVQAHPFRDEIQLAPLEYIDGIEVFNGCQNEVSRNDRALEYGNNTNKILTSGSDFHTASDLARGGIITEIEIKDSKQLVNVLKKQNYKLKRE